MNETEKSVGFGRIAVSDQRSESKPIPVQEDLLTINLSEIKIRPVHWVVKNFIPRGMLTLLSGHGAAGKSSLLAHFIACVTQGQCAFGIDYPDPVQGDVLIYNCEDAAHEVLVPRLIASGADLKKVRLITGVRGRDGNPIPFSLLNIDQLTSAFQNHPFGVLVIDPISSVVGNTGAKDNSESDIRPLLEGIAKFAENTGVAVIGVKHLGKGDRETAALRVLGSIAFSSVARMVLAVTLDPEDSSRRILARSKTNLPIVGVEGDQGISFTTEQPPQARELIIRHAPHLSEKDVEILADQLYQCANFSVWNGDIDSLVSGRPRGHSGSADSSIIKDKAAQWLRDVLQNGPKESLECVKEGNASLGLEFKLDWWRVKILNGLLAGKSSRQGKKWIWKLSLPTVPNPTT